MGDMISTFLIGLMILAQINGHKQVPNLNFAVVASKNALPLWRKLIQTYAQNRSRHVNVIFPLKFFFSHKLFPYSVFALI